MADGRTPRGAGEDGATSPDPVGPASAVRPFLLTAGRVAPTASGRPVPVETQVVATPAGLESLDRLSFEQH
ncbi:MAG: multi-component regulatory system-4, partial [Kitasatospora sp.]|nr:multi-component regulatory system-4 [Kitasatospora sp.]